MAVARWWDGDAKERYWCEITSREDLGNDLMCPQTNEAGKPYWSYSLINDIAPGDVVFHYSTHDRAVVGVSLAAGRAVEHQWEWTPHSSVGRRGEVVDPRPAWRLPLRAFTITKAPFTLDDAEKDQDWIRGWLSAARKVGPAAAPFMPYASGLRGFQGYLTKMPSAFVDRYAQLAALASAAQDHNVQRVIAGADNEDDAMQALAATWSTRARGQRFMLTAGARRAVELCAMKAAESFYREKGYAVQVVGKPFDLRCTRHNEIRYVEVKGTTTAGEDVFLTPNEVAFAREHTPAMSLFVLRNVTLKLDGPEPIAEGGEPAVIEPWDIRAGELTPLMFSYRWEN